MEDDKPNVNLEDKVELKNLLINKADEEVSDGPSSGNEEKKNIEVTQDSPKSSSKDENCKAGTPTPARSPEPSCAICLEQLTNKSFTNSCFHMFCFTCLVEWSKVKPECPLCKQSFTSIVHNVRSFDEFDQYHVHRSRTPENVWDFGSFRYRTSIGERVLGSNRRRDYSNRIESEMASHRMRYAPHSVHHVRMYSQPQIIRRMPCAFRRRIYEENLWVRFSSNNRIRCASPAFFQRNIACTHRLLPWLNRELLVIMPNNESQIPFVIELIMALIVKYDITSQEFYTHIEPYTAPHTSHFIHEFYNFAVSPHEMDTYDNTVDYDNLPFEPIRVNSSPDSDVIPLPTNETTRKSRREKKHAKHMTRKRHAEFRRKLTKIVLKRNNESNCWEAVASFPRLLSCNEVSSTNPLEMPGPSTSRDTMFPDFAPESSNQQLEKSSEVECIQDDEIEIVEILKPKRERTPEVVDLSSDDGPNTTENLNITQSNCAEDFKTSNNVIELSSDPPVSSDEDDVMFLSEEKGIPSSPIDILEISDKPIDYSLKIADRTIELESKSEDVEPSSSNRKDTPELEWPEPKKLQSALRVSSNDNDTRSSWSPISKPKKRRATILDDSSTESCSETAQVSELNTRIKKLKLRSVVAHFSYDPSDERNDSPHHSLSHRKHKERKKKKKKHKRRHLIYSSDSA